MRLCILNLLIGLIYRLCLLCAQLNFVQFKRLSLRISGVGNIRLCLFCTFIYLVIGSLNLSFHFLLSFLYRLGLFHWLWLLKLLYIFGCSLMVLLFLAYYLLLHVFTFSLPRALFVRYRRLANYRASVLFTSLPYMRKTKVINQFTLLFHFLRVQILAQKRRYELFTVRVLTLWKY